MDTFTLITTQADLERWRPTIEAIDTAALDFEGWNLVRLAQIANDDLWIVIDFGEKGKNWFREAAPIFDQGQAWVAFNNKHEKKCFAEHGGVYPTVWDSANLRKALEGGGHMSLKLLVQWELGEEMDKEEQTSDWDHGDLTDSQLNYAANDAVVTWDLWQHMRSRADSGHMRCFNLLDGMTDAAMEMERNGLLLDQAHHKELVHHWRELADERTARIRELITEEELPNLNSGKQLTNFMLPILPDEVLQIWPTTPKTGLLSTKNKDLITVAGMLGRNPLSDTLRLMAERATLEKYLSSFGETLINHARTGKGRVHARYNIAAAVTCRFSCSGPNLQQIPRDRDFFGERHVPRNAITMGVGTILDARRVVLLAFGEHKADTTLRQVNCHVDLMDWKPVRQGKKFERVIAELCACLSARRYSATPGAPIGILSHHLVHDDNAWETTEKLMALIAGRSLINVASRDQLLVPVFG